MRRLNQKEEILSKLLSRMEEKVKQIDFIEAKKVIHYIYEYQPMHR